jgi:amidase
MNPGVYRNLLCFDAMLTTVPRRFHRLPLVTLLITVAIGAPGAQQPAPVPPFPLEEATIEQLQRWQESGRYTSVALARLYLDRIRALDQSGPKVNAIIEINPDALSIAGEMDRERRAGRARGPLHGIPVVIKDNIDTGDKMMTSAGSLALVGAPAPKDAFIAARLRQAGAVILAKANLSEWANFRSSKSSSGWSGRGGQTKNPYVLDRNPCGSSSGTGSAVAANFAAAGIGTETDGSIVCPSSAVGLVGLKPTVGLVSRTGIVPISHSQDTAGPMARSVGDAAALLTVIAGSDLDDPVTANGRDHIAPDYTKFLDANALKGARIGVARAKVTGYSPAADRLYERAIADLKKAGAEIVDPADIGHMGEYDDTELQVLLYEFKADLNAYLARRTGVPIATLADAIAFNETTADREMPYFGQELFLQAQGKGALTEEEYTKALEKDRTLSREGIDSVLMKHRLDAIIAPTGSPAWPTDPINGDHFTGSSSTPAAVAGYPTITVPMGEAFRLPVGLTFIGTAWSEGRLISLAYAYEQATKHRKAPTFVPTIEYETARPTSQLDK